MRKHFLLLFLMALLPLAGWAQTATFGEMSLGNYTYGDLNLPVPQVKDSEGAILNTNDHYTVVEGAFTDEACTQAIALADMKADGTKYYRKVEGKGTYVGQIEDCLVHGNQKAVEYHRHDKLRERLQHHG